MTHEKHHGEGDNINYYPVVSKKVAQDVEKLWLQYPDLMRTRTRAQIGEFSPNLVQLLDIMEQFGNASPELPKRTGQTIGDGMMQAFSMMVKQANEDHKQLIHLQFDPYEFSDRELPGWGLLEEGRRTGRKVTTKNIITSFLAQNKEIAEVILDDSRTRANSTYFLAGAALVTQLYYEACHQPERKQR